MIKTHAATLPRPSWASYRHDGRRKQHPVEFEQQVGYLGGVRWVLGADVLDYMGLYSD